MNTHVAGSQTSGTWSSAVSRWRRAAWLVILIADVGLLLWGAFAALIPEHLPGPRGAAILPAGYDGYTHGSWQQLAATSPKTAGYITLVFRMYGIYGAAFGLLAIAIVATAYRRGERWAWWSLLVGNTIAFVAAMTYDRIVGAIGPFELSEYLGLAVIWGSLAITFRSTRHPGQDGETNWPRASQESTEQRDGGDPGLISAQVARGGRDEDRRRV